VSKCFLVQAHLVVLDKWAIKWVLVRLHRMHGVQRCSLLLLMFRDRMSSSQTDTQRCVCLNHELCQNN